MQWVQTEYERHERARTGCSCGTLQKSEKHHSADRMQHDAHQVMRAAPRSEKLPVGHVRNPRQRKRALRVSRLERPCDARKAQSAAYMRIRRKHRVVIVDEIVAGGLPVNQENPREQQQADPDAGAQRMSRGLFWSRAFNAAVCFGARHPEESRLT